MSVGIRCGFDSSRLSHGYRRVGVAGEEGHFAMSSDSATSRNSRSKSGSETTASDRPERHDSDMINNRTLLCLGDVTRRS